MRVVGKEVGRKTSPQMGTWFAPGVTVTPRFPLEKNGHPPTLTRTRSRRTTRFGHPTTRTTVETFLGQNDVKKETDNRQGTDRKEGRRLLTLCGHGPGPPYSHLLEFVETEGPRVEDPFTPGL